MHPIGKFEPYITFDPPHKPRTKMGSKFSSNRKNHRLVPTPPAPSPLPDISTSDRHTSGGDCVYLATLEHAYKTGVIDRNTYDGYRLLNLAMNQSRKW